ncbi:hypothetical protein CDN99_21990 [Roseateles aquatilis]|uniref:Rhodanese domain-containing protein n=1 Tax=Roseateles aquatilis TaxID=431061 RepID=A0A246IZJ1_9BURK|nr:HesA/MoeB/ThiF family protein [Roseateles aquatilis]OWQ85746.1 hypothetical protein CDN99_21990 [Roseateles aquatilis]
MLNGPTEAAYYARHFRLPGFNQETQRKLQQARVLIIGMGGLGCPAATYLVGAGVGTLGLCDADEVSLSNLHRQALFDMHCIGEKKIKAASRRLRTMNPFISVVELDQFVGRAGLQDLIRDYHVVIDCTDNFASKYDINDACESAEIPLVYGSIFQFEGQVSVFHLPGIGGDRGYSYRDIYPSAPPSGLAQNCGDAGVLGVLPGMIGALQANEAIKVIAGIGEPLAGTLLVFDALGAVSQRLELKRRDESIQSGESLEYATVNELSVLELCERLQGEAAPVLLDVREVAEREALSLGGIHIPLGALASRLGEIPMDRDLVIYCQSGLRAYKAALYLTSERSGQQVFSLQGGASESARVLLERLKESPRGKDDRRLSQSSGGLSGRPGADV